MSRWRGVRDLNPRGPTDHRLSRPAPYQARRTPHKILCSARNLKKVSVPPKPSFYKTSVIHTLETWAGCLAWLGCSPYAAEVAGSNPVRPTTPSITEPSEHLILCIYVGSEESFSFFSSCSSLSLTASLMNSALEE